MFLRLIILGLLINRTDVHGWLVGHSRGSGQGNHIGSRATTRVALLRWDPLRWEFFTIPLCVEMALIERAFNRE